MNLILFAAAGVMWVRLSRPAKDDPRLSKGLQLLQSKIAVLEDLSDRTEIQVSQLTALLETKCRELQEKIVAADKQIARIDQSAQKSLEVAQIFQDRIPHSEILERQNTIKYVKAARMAHRGASVEDIAREVDLSRAEIEFIAKVNREQLQFSEADLPAWAQEGRETATSPVPANGAAQEVRYSLPREEFSRGMAADTAAAPAPASKPTPAAPAPVVETAAPVAQQSFVEFDLSGQGPVSAAVPTPPTMKAQTTSGKTVEVRPVNFPRIETNR
ncbi:MAG: DUF2802 domain-containing protein [Bdellovibrionaceae bacterium]|nr:DUF2802 domain-containing protein [Pseudobdellovibrionaceae bacterium]MBX3032848.1 DUF2802 domain-containing protein [Pseudobdellovibrionaceae bacterium]